MGEEVAGSSPRRSSVGVQEACKKVYLLPQETCFLTQLSGEDQSRH